MPRSGPGSRIREPPVHCATRGPPSHALRGATDEGVGIAHGGAPALGADRINDQLPVPKTDAPPAAPAWPSAASAPTPSSGGCGCWGFRAWSGWEGGGIREIQAADSWPSGCNPAQVTPDASPSFGCCDVHAADRWPQRAGRSGSLLTSRPYRGF